MPLLLVLARTQVFSYRTVGVEAAQAGIYVRWGCMCNPGACYGATSVVSADGSWMRAAVVSHASAGCTQPRGRR